ncbi:MAG TPA: fumarylacetoacetate hydrolase family protein [Candidatus Nitrosocosmicus sp.]|nr:fumarylacetoacetate hydrolase family protein [Candidatus Nitrosocosmicus sp.]
MKFIRFERQSAVSYGVVEDEVAYRIEGDIFGDYRVTEERYKLRDIKVLAPCKPSKIVAVGINYKDHATEMKHDLPEDPVIFIKPSTAVIGPEEKIVRPAVSQRVDYEAELALVIGKTAKNVEPQEAFQYILGATCLNDVTARDLQKKDGQWTRAKGFDTFAPMGPFIVTGLDYNNIDIELALNGETRQKSNTSCFITKAQEIVSYISKIMTLNPGDVIATGTPSGVGPLSKGDIVEVKLKGVGILRNYVE